MSSINYKEVLIILVYLRRALEPSEVGSAVTLSTGLVTASTKAAHNATVTSLTGGVIVVARGTLTALFTSKVQQTLALALIITGGTATHSTSHVTITGYKTKLRV